MADLWRHSSFFLEYAGGETRWEELIMHVCVCVCVCMLYFFFALSITKNRTYRQTDRQIETELIDITII